MEEFLLEFTKNLSSTATNAADFDVDVDIFKTVTKTTTIAQTVDLTGNSAILFADVEALGDNTEVEVDTSILTIANQLSSISVFAESAAFNEPDAEPTLIGGDATLTGNTNLFGGEAPGPIDLVPPPGSGDDITIEFADLDSYGVVDGLTNLAVPGGADLPNLPNSLVPGNTTADFDIYLPEQDLDFVLTLVAVPGTAAANYELANGPVNLELGSFAPGTEIDPDGDLATDDSFDASDQQLVLTVPDGSIFAVVQTLASVDASYVGGAPLALSVGGTPITAAPGPDLTFTASSPFEANEGTYTLTYTIPDIIVDV